MNQKKTPRTKRSEKSNEPRSALAHMGGQVESRGDAAFAANLAAALELAGEVDADFGTHGMHAYPARMHASIATHLIERLTQPGERVVDPFCGSGTVLVEAMTLGRRSAGVDLNPVAIRVAEVKTTLVDAEGRARLLALMETIAAESEDRVRTRTPVHAPLSREEARWYEGHTLKELAGLKEEIDKVESEEDRRILEVLFSAIVVKFSVQRAETTPKEEKRRIRKGLPTEFFLRRGREWLSRWEALEDEIFTRSPEEVFVPRLVEGDARKLKDYLGGTPVELILSSPPYGGTYNYVEHHARRYPWFGIDTRDLMHEELGARRDLNGPGQRERGSEAADRWDDQVITMLKAMRKIIRPGSHVVLLVGDGQVGGVRISADKQLEALAHHARMEVVAVASQKRPDWTGRGVRREHLVQLAVATSGDREGDAEGDSAQSRR